jgi:hypothetical protein
MDRYAEVYNCTVKQIVEQKKSPQKQEKVLSYSSLFLCVLWVLLRFLFMLLLSAVLYKESRQCV